MAMLRAAVEHRSDNIHSFAAFGRTQSPVFRHRPRSKMRSPILRAFERNHATPANPADIRRAIQLRREIAINRTHVADATSSTLLKIWLIYKVVGAPDSPRAPTMLATP